MAYGADGNLYVAHYASGFVRVVAPDGAIAASLPSGGPTPTNVAFWRGSLYVTEGAGGAVYRLDHQRARARPVHAAVVMATRG